VRPHFVEQAQQRQLIEQIRRLQGDAVEQVTFGVLERRTMPTTSYPFSSSNSARYDPS